MINTNTNKKEDTSISNPTKNAEDKLDDQYQLLKADLSPEQKQAVKIYKTVLQFLGIDNTVNPNNPVLSPDMIDYQSSPYISLDKDQLMYYIGVLCGVRPYLCEEMTDAKARAVYSTIWRKFNEVGFKVNYRKDKLRQEIENLERKIVQTSQDPKITAKAKQTAKLGIKKHYTEDNLKDEASWRTYTWNKIEGEKIRKAELLSQYVNSIDNLIVALKERIRYAEPEKGQSKYYDQTNTPMP